MPNFNLSEMQLDTIREVANIGLGHSMTSLAQMTGHTFRMSVPSIESVPVEKIPTLLPSTDPVVAIYMPVYGALTGHLMFMFAWDSALSLWDMILGQHPQGFSDVDDMYASMMLEVGNIIIGGYLSAISDMTNLTFHAEVPYLAVDTPDVLLASIACEAGPTQTCALALETRIQDDSTEGHFFYFPSEGGMEQLLNALGVKEAA